METPLSGAPQPPPQPERPAQKRTLSRVIGGTIAVLAIGVASFGSISSANAGQDIHSSLTLIAPAAAGGGWDTVAREMQQTQRANGLAANVQVVNMPGAGGTIALGNMSRLEGRANTLLVGGTGLLAATIQYGSDATLDDVTPLAVLFEEYDVIVVPADSPYETLSDLVAAWQENPGAVPWTGGGSFDQLVVTDLALAAGINPVDTTYISSDGGGEAVAALLNGTVQAAAGGYPDNIDQIQSGRLRALALVAEEPVPGIDIPTAREQGFDITLANWRMLAAPAGITGDEAGELTELIEDTLATPEWTSAVERYYWTEQVITGTDVAPFLAQEHTRITRLYEEMGQ
ncbi:tripartite tricarboxylate transporter substrate binding protein [Leucobacter luti]|uniref:Putative tricarboxylic transport membrane protein n=1 Tax=Leucobacter luti TaxID=340320 RepID=A0A4R6RR49_9MICO|nr:tripartite tricarboxylate transporter substrate-binding protein [Leucobacter luti]MCW2289499.1 putative tricarboxylic transport membrane protein [Leucobacter luti]QYM74744.1 tripartite tricarboxylate transporter substrate binding protein [Leucobacter luti]TCK33890.1 putative tricarboxylic transport membrane protein [Leucobacter luti]TDP89144.1 putative tricarboxylic transport membrane protein [Leucobacter luti]